MQDMRAHLLIAMIVAVLTACAGPTSAPTLAPTPARSDEDQEVTSLVESFGHRLQLVSLLSPTAAQDIQTQYGPYVSPALLELWSNTPKKAPGRMVSSPWPDRIELASIVKVTSDKYTVTGNIVEITSEEVTNAGTANVIPVRLTVEKSNGQWLITEYTQENPLP